MSYRFSPLGLRRWVTLVAFGLALTAAGCIDVQSAYDEGARSQCRSLPNVSDRQACMDNVARNSAQKRSDQNGH